MDQGEQIFHYALILRLVEPLGRSVRARYALPSQAGEFDLTLRPHEIRTVRLSTAPVFSIREAGLLE